MDLIKIIQKFGMEYIGRYYSKYRAIVTNTDDPEGMGIIEVNVPSANNLITSARPLNPGGMYVEGDKSKVHGVKYLSPKVGDIVMVEFDKGNPSIAYWSYASWGLGERPEELDDPDTLGIVTPEGNKIYLQDKEGKLTMKINKNIFVEVDEGTTVEITKDLLEVNKGTNRGVVKIEALEALVTAVQADLLVARSGANTAAWMAQWMALWEDKKFTH